MIDKRFPFIDIFIDDIQFVERTALCFLGFAQNLTRSFESFQSVSALFLQFFNRLTKSNGQGQQGKYYRNYLSHILFI
jgi:hypothetical protein